MALVSTSDSWVQESKADPCRGVISCSAQLDPAAEAHLPCCFNEVISFQHTGTRTLVHSEPDPSRPSESGSDGEKAPSPLTRSPVSPDSVMQMIPCFVCGSAVMRGDGSTEEPFRAVTTTSGSNALLPLLLLRPGGGNRAEALAGADGEKD